MPLNVPVAALSISELQRSLGWLFVTPEPQHDKRAINQN
jgi:hypothetical protein